MNLINRIPAPVALAIIILCFLGVGYMEGGEHKINEQIEVGK
jgi:hypothetical protein